MRVLLGVLLGVMGAAGQVPDLFSLLDPSGVTAYSSEPFARVGTIPTQPYVRFFFAHPDGLRYYAISATGPEGVWVISTAAPYPVLKKIPVADAVAAAMSPDGRRIVQIESAGLSRVYTLTVLDLATDTVAVRLRLPYEPRQTVAISQDSSTAYFLTVSPGRLYAFDLRTNTLSASSLEFPIAEEVQIAPNGLVYVAAGRNLVAVDGKTLTPVDTIPLTPDRTIGLGFDPDGEFAFTNADVINLRTRQAVPWATDTSGALLGGLIALGNRRAVAKTRVDTGFAVTAEPLGRTALPASTVWSAVTNEYPSAQFLFGVSDRRLRRYDQRGQFLPIPELPIESNAVVYARRSGAGSPMLLLSFNTIQTIRGSELARPLVARALDGAGRPLNGVAVTFNSSLVMTTVMTNRDGYAQVDLPAGTAPGQYVVAASAGAAPPVTFNLTVALRPNAPARLNLVSGAGQYHNGFDGATPIVMQALDSLGQPWPGLPIRFRLLANAGRLGPVTHASCGAGECTVWTDERGMASVDFYVEPGQLPSQLVFQTIAATGGGASIEVPATVFPSFSTPQVEFFAPTEDLTGLAGTTIPNAIRLRARLSVGGSSPAPFTNLWVIGNIGERERIPLCSVLTDSNGDATCSLRLPDRPGKYTLRVLLGGERYSHIRKTIALTVYANQPQVEFRPSDPPQTGAERTFEVSAFHPGVATPFGILNLLVNDALDGRRACYVAYSVADRQIYLVKDDGPEEGLRGPLSLTGTGSVSNSQCTVLAEGSSTAGTVERPVVRLRVRFHPSFSGPKLLSVAARTRNDTATSGWLTADLIPLPATNPTVGPAALPQDFSRLSGAQATITFRYRSGGGQNNLQTVWGLIGSSLDAKDACYFAYYVPGRSFLLFPDSGIPASAPVELTGSSSFANSQCRILFVRPEYVNGTLQLQMAIETKAGFAGNKIIWGAASTLQNAISPWTPLAVWRVDP